jgi:Tat protein translocase TatB subunit
MPEVGPAEIFMVVLIALIVFGPEKLPEMARSIGKALSNLRRVADEAKDEFQFGLDFNEDDQDHPMKQALDHRDERPDPRRYPEPQAGAEDGEERAAPFDSDGDGWSTGTRTSLTPIPTTLEPSPPREDSDNV